MGWRGLGVYPPGFVQQFTGFSCDATRWCVALTIDSLSLDPVNGRSLNPTCQSQILGGLEYVNFAYLTKSGVPQGPPDPLHFQFIGSGQPDPTKVLFLNPGDQARVTMHDTAQGLLAQVDDLTTGESGSMTASAANGVRADQVRARYRYDAMQGAALRLPPDVLHVQPADPRTVDGAQLQRRVLRRDRALRLLHEDRREHR